MQNFSRVAYLAAERGDLLAAVSGYLGDTILLPSVPVHDRELLLPVLEFQSAQQRRRKPARGMPSMHRSLAHLSSHPNVCMGLDAVAALVGCPGCGAPAPSGLTTKLSACAFSANERPTTFVGALSRRDRILRLFRHMSILVLVTVFCHHWHELLESYDPYCVIVHTLIRSIFILLDFKIKYSSLIECQECLSIFFF